MNGQSSIQKRDYFLDLPLFLAPLNVQCYLLFWDYYDSQLGYPLPSSATVRPKGRGAAFHPLLCLIINIKKSKSKHQFDYNLFSEPCVQLRQDILMFIV